MEFAILVLLIAGSVAFIASFFKKDRYSELENQMEHLSISVMQELYKVKKKQKQLEEELIIDTERENA